MSVALNMDEKRLDAKAISEYGDTGTAVKSEFERKLMEVKIAYEDSIKEVKSFKKTYSGYMEMFPTKVKNLEF